MHVAESWNVGLTVEVGFGVWSMVLSNGKGLRDCEALLGDDRWDHSLLGLYPFLQLKFCDSSFVEWLS